MDCVCSILGVIDLRLITVLTFERRQRKEQDILHIRSDLQTTSNMFYKNNLFHNTALIPLTIQQNKIQAGLQSHLSNWLVKDKIHLVHEEN